MKSAIAFILGVVIAGLLIPAAEAFKSKPSKPWLDAVDGQGNPLACYYNDPQPLVCVPKEQ